MASKFFGPSLGSFFSYLGVNLTVFILPLIVCFIFEYWLLGFGLNLFALLFLGVLFWGTDRAIAAPEDMQVIKYTTIHKIPWDEILEVVILAEIAYSLFPLGRLKTTNIRFLTRQQPGIDIYTSVWPPEIETAFINLLIEKSQQYHFLVREERFGVEG